MADIKENRLKLDVAGCTSAADRAITALRRFGRIMAHWVRSETIDALFDAELFPDMGSEPLPMLARIAPDEE